MPFLLPHWRSYKLNSSVLQFQSPFCISKLFEIIGMSHINVRSNGRYLSVVGIVPKRAQDLLMSQMTPDNIHSLSYNTLNTPVMLDDYLQLNNTTNFSLFLKEKLYMYIIALKSYLCFLQFLLKYFLLCFQLFKFLSVLYCSFFI